MTYTLRYSESASVDAGMQQLLRAFHSILEHADT